MAPEIDYKRWIVPFYGKFLHANFMAPGMFGSPFLPQQARQQWLDLLRRELKNITPEIVGDLIMDRDWRTQICGAYFCGFNRWDDFTLDIGRRLVAKKNGLATQGYAFALARMPSHAAANYLCGYLSRVGHHTDETGAYSGDLEWVIAALQWIDEQMGTHRIESWIEKMIPLQQKVRFDALERRYLEISQYARFPGVTAKYPELLEQQRMRMDAEMKTYFLPDDGERRSDWFWELMEFCRANFD